MHSPVLAMLWENWQLTRNEVAQRLVMGIILAAAVLAWSAASGPIETGTARNALLCLVMTHAFLSLAVGKLNGGRFMDGYRPGYPFYFLYTRPVRTFVLVGAPMAYLVVSAAAGYIVAALVLRATFGFPFPLRLAAWIAAFHVVQWTVQWGTSNKAVQWIGSTLGSIGFAALALWHWREWPARLDVSIGDYVLLAAIGVASFGLAVAGVARQRRGDARATSPRTVTRSAFSDWLAGRFRLPCPTSSPIAAQVWFDLKSGGLPVLAIGGALAILIPLLFVATTQLDVALAGPFSQPATRMFAVGVALFSLPAVLLLGGNAFGIRTRQGRKYASAFEATQACGTARMAGLKVLVRSACLLTALAAAVTSFWISASVIPFDVLEDNDTFIEKSRSPVSGVMRAIRGGIGAMSAYELLALAFVTVSVVAAMVAARAALPALRARYPRRMKIVTALLLLHGFVLVMLVQAEQIGIASTSVLYAAQDVTNRVIGAVGAASVLATVYLFWTVLAEGLLTPRQACGVLLVSAAFGASWMTVLTAADVPLSTMPPIDAVQLVMWPTLLPLMASVLAPWSLSRVRQT